MVVRHGPAIVLSLVLGAAALVIAPSAVAGDGGTVKATTNCSDKSDSRLKVSTIDGDRLEVVGVVFADDEDTWDWKFKHNDDLSYEGNVKAKDADRSFRIVRTMVNLNGPDLVLFRAQNRRTDEVCRVSMYY